MGHISPTQSLEKVRKTKKPASVPQPEDPKTQGTSIAPAEGKSVLRGRSRLFARIQEVLALKKRLTYLA